MHPSRVDDGEAWSVVLHLLSSTFFIHLIVGSCQGGTAQWQIQPHPQMISTLSNAGSTALRTSFRCTHPMYFRLNIVRFLFPQQPFIFYTLNPPSRRRGRRAALRAPVRGVGSRRPRQTEGSLTDYNEDCVFIMRVMLAVLTLPCAAAASGRRLLSGPAAEPPHTEHASRSPYAAALPRPACSRVISLRSELLVGILDGVESFLRALVGALVGVQAQRELVVLLADRVGGRRGGTSQAKAVEREVAKPQYVLHRQGDIDVEERRRRLRGRRHRHGRRRAP